MRKKLQEVRCFPELCFLEYRMVPNSKPLYGWGSYCPPDRIRRIAQFETDWPIPVNVECCPSLSVADGGRVLDGKAISNGPKILAALDRKRQLFDIDARARFACHRATGRGAGRLLANGGAPCSDFCRCAGWFSER